MGKGLQYRKAVVERRLGSKESASIWGREETGGPGPGRRGKRMASVGIPTVKLVRTIGPPPLK